MKKNEDFIMAKMTSSWRERFLKTKKTCDDVCSLNELLEQGVVWNLSDVGADVTQIGRSLHNF